MLGCEARDPTPAGRGARIFQRTCSGCHGADGRGSVSFTVDGVSLRGGATPVLDADGASVVLHAAPDDYRTDPSGNSGARIACGVFG